VQLFGSDGNVHLSVNCIILNVLFQVKENNVLKTMQHELAELRIKVESLKGVEAEIKRITLLLHDKERELETVLISLQHERDEKIDLVNEKEHVEKERREEVERMNIENTKLKAELDELNERIKSNEIGAEGKS
jgi:chromosome segregation ATPase